MLPNEAFLPEIGVTRADIENWIARLPLTTEYQETRRGKPRLYSLDNAVELAGIAAHVKAGCPPRSAVAYAAMIVRNHKAGTLRNWIVFPVGRFDTGRGADDLSEIDLAALAELSLQRGVLAIHIGDTIARLERLFAGANG